MQKNYRGKRKDNMEWVNGYYTEDPDLGLCYIQGWEYWNSPEGLQRAPFTLEVIPETVGQYTGLKDKNGKEIYEGDILDISYFLTKEKGIVKFGMYKQCDMSSDYECGNQGYYIDVTNDENEMMRHDIYFYAHEAKVIGNTTDNPELLQEVDK
jgi:uncharacterized phage protein (TIGR01671 family)